MDKIGLASGLLGAMYDNKQPRVEFFQDKKLPPNKEWRWQIWFSSDIVAASSEGYATLAAAKENLLNIENHIRWLRENGKIN
ncbi:MAG: hypothetical protein EOO07_25575 [Chitinophagaceae bacterium]|nr:MAG: hypothetical protein EOO07_25575 [Chitinophagaceae bacterium]